MDEITFRGADGGPGGQKRGKSKKMEVRKSEGHERKRGFGRWMKCPFKGTLDVHIKMS